MPTQRYDRRTNQWLLVGDGQAVVFSPDVKSIDVYSVGPNRNMEPLRECPIPGGYRYTDASSPHGANLFDRIVVAGAMADPAEIVWDELGRWFDSYFPASAEVTR